MTTRPWLDIVIGRTMRALGIPITQRTNLNFGTGFTVADDPANDQTTITAAGGGGGGSAVVVTTLTALRAYDSTTLTDGQEVTVKDDPVPWLWSATTGAGFVDDSETNVKPNAILTANAGRYYRKTSAPVLATIAALRAAVTGRHKSIHVQAFSTLGDRGGGLFDYDPTDTTSADDDGTIIVAGTRRYKRRFSGALHTEWFGMKADGRHLTDGVVVAAANTLTSASAAFTLADQGKRIVVRTPSLPIAGTVSVAIGDFQIAGSNFFAEFNWNSGNGPLVGALCIYIDGNYYSINTLTDTTLYLHGLIVANATAKPLYKEQQKEAFVKYVSPTQITLWTDATFTTPVNAVIGQSSVHAFLATDDVVSIEAAMAASQALSIGEVQMSAGRPGIFSNMGWTNYSNVKLTGAGPTATVVTDLRKCSREVPFGTWNYQAAFTYITCSNCQFEDFGYDALVPVLGAQHSTGGISNASGGRLGFLIEDSAQSTYRRIGWAGYGARDEHLYLSGSMGVQSPNFAVSECVLGLPGQPLNNAGLNIATGNGIGDGILIDNNVVYSILSALELSVDSAIITNNHFGGYEGWKSGAEIAVCSATGRLIIAHNEFRNHDSSQSGVGAIQINNFGIWNDPDLVLELSDNLFANLKGLYGGTNGAGVIDLENFTGTAYITGNLARNIICDNVAGFNPGRMIQIKGASTGQVYIGGNVMPCNSSGGSLMQTGVYVDATVPAGNVHILPGNDFGDAPTPYNLTAATSPVALVANATTNPSANPVSGYLEYASGGAPFRRHADGTVD